MHLTPERYKKNISRYLARDDDNNDGDDKDDDEGNSWHQKADDDAEDFDEGCLIWFNMIQKKKFPASRIFKRTKSNVKLEGPSSIHGKDFSNTKRLF